MGKDDISAKKRRKLNTTSSNDATKLSPAEIYKKVVEFEQLEAYGRQAERDSAFYKKICQDVRHLFSVIAELKTKDTDEAKEKIKSKRIEASLLLVGLKKINRLEKVRIRAIRETLHKAKQSVDSTHLRMQNMLYEADHLNKEVIKCQQFNSKVEEIELVSLEDFFDNAPSEITQAGLIKMDNHLLQLARLEWELRQRRELGGLRNELIASKEQVAAAISAAQSRLDRLDSHLQDVLKSTKPLQECLAIRLDEKRERSQAAALLPQPLFLLFANAVAFTDVLGTKVIAVAIVGDEDEAKRCEQLPIVESEVVVSNDSDSDQENNDDDHGECKKKRHHRTAKISKEERVEAKKMEIFKKHPLSVQVTIKSPDETAVNLIFFYMIHLKIIVVKCTMNFLKPVTGVSAADVLNDDNILNELYIGDTGTDSPHPATNYLLNTAGISEPFSYFISDIGKPYMWAQRLCGLDFTIVNTDIPKSKKSMQLCQNLSVASVENFISVIKKRLRARVELMKELQDMESGKIVPKKGFSCPVRLSGSLTQWQSIAWSEYSQAPMTSFLISEGLVTPIDMLYRAIITRQSAKLVALVAINSDYPEKSPLITLTLHWNGTHTAATNDDIRDIERAINTDWEMTEKVQSTLSNQMLKLLICLDILLESIGSSEFPPDKVILQSVRGRNRMKPYKFLNQGVGVFVQY